MQRRQERRDVRNANCLTRNKVPCQPDTRQASQGESAGCHRIYTVSEVNSALPAARPSCSERCVVLGHLRMQVPPSPQSDKPAGLKKEHQVRPSQAPCIETGHQFWRLMPSQGEEPACFSTLSLWQTTVGLPASCCQARSEGHKAIELLLRH